MITKDNLNFLSQNEINEKISNNNDELLNIYLKIRKIKETIKTIERSNDNYLLKEKRKLYELSKIGSLIKEEHQQEINKLNLKYKIKIMENNNVNTKEKLLQEYNIDLENINVYYLEQTNKYLELDKVQAELFHEMNLWSEEERDLFVESTHNKILENHKYIVSSTTRINAFYEELNNINNNLIM